MIKFIESDLQLYVEQAKPFPQDVSGAFERIFKTVPDATKRGLYGLSYMNEKGEIIYFAALEKFANDTLEHKAYSLKSGYYLSETLVNFAENLEKMPKIFQKLYSHADIDPTSLCVEHYENNTDVICMVRLKDKQ